MARAAVAALAAVGPFVPGGTFATLTATASSASVALPSGAAVLLQNTGGSAVSCTLGIGSATAAANEIILQPASPILVQVGANTFAACIDQAGTSSNLVVLTGGANYAAGNNADAVAVAGTGLQPELAYNMCYNGTSWDRCSAYIPGTQDSPSSATLSVVSLPSANASAGLTIANTTALATSLVVKATPGNLYQLTCSGIAGAAAGNCIVYNGTSAPSTGALTGANVLAACSYAASSAAGCTINYSTMGAAFSAGIVVLISSAASPLTYTTGTNTGFISAAYR